MSFDINTYVLTAKKTATVHKLFEGSRVRFFGLLLKTYFKNSYFEASTIICK